MSVIAVVQTAFIGDVVLATPLFESARKSVPGAKIIGVVRAGCENLLRNNPYIDEIVVWGKRDKQKGLRGIIEISIRLKKNKIDTALIPHRSFRTGLALFLSGAEKRIGFNKGGGAFLHNLRVPYKSGIHEVERNLMLARAAGWKSDGFRPAIFPDDNDREKIDKILSGESGYCVFAPGSVWPTKIWPEEYYIETGKIFSSKGLRVIVSGGDKDINICKKIAENIPGALNICGLLTLRQSAEIYMRSEFVLTGDSAPQHIASAVNAKVFAIFGPTIRDFGFWPYNPKGFVIEENHDCRPCGIHGHNSCPAGTHICMKSINHKKVTEFIEKNLD